MLNQKQKLIKLLLKGNHSYIYPTIKKNSNSYFNKKHSSTSFTSISFPLNTRTSVAHSHQPYSSFALAFPFTNNGTSSFFHNTTTTTTTSLSSSFSSFSPTSLFPRVTCRPFHTYSSSNFRISSRVFTPLSSKPKDFFEASSSTRNNLSPYTIMDFFDKPFSTTHNQFVFSHGVSGIPKQSEKLVSTIPNGPYLSIACGEDSFFRRHDSLGVADGVGGWKNIKTLSHAVVDSSLYSRKLMHYSLTEIEKYHNKFERDQFYNYDNFQPVNIMQASYEKTLHDCTMEGVIGSSTALLAILHKDELRIANLGDCGIGVIRHNGFIFCSDEMQRSFNCPFQLGSNSFNTPKDAQTFTIKVQHGDIVVMGSDGLFDNLYKDDILDEIIPFSSIKGGLKVEPQIISDALAWRAKEASEDINHESPFESHATQEGLYYRGGKKDDITILIAVITDSNNTQ